MIPSFRAHGTLHSVTYGESISLGLTGGLAYLSWSSFTKSPATPRTLNVFCLILLAALGLSQTRGAWLGFTASLLVLVWLRRNLLPFVLKSGAILTLILAFLSRSTGLHLFNRFVSIFHPQGDPNIGRLELWKTAWNMFKDHPWLGVGLNNYRTLFSRYHPTPIYGEEVWGSAHNLYLHQLAERGILGLLALLLLLGSMVYYSIKRYRKNPSPLNTWNLAALVGFLIMNLTETSFETTMSWMPIIFLYAWSEKTDATSAGWGQEAQGKKED
ncbi:MAG: O-antigen ligase family protein [Elusimicrobia bacterium]|nr:O-antigen ligase family protein [Elusimicrobiota bacterium]